MNEFELKFEVPTASLAKLLAAVRTKKAQLQLLQACYFDTQDQALARHGVVIRIRRENSAWVQTIKASTNDALERLEHNLTFDGDANDVNNAMPIIDLSQKIPKNIRQLFESILKINLDQQTPALIPVFETDVQRLKFDVTHAGSKIEIALDQGMVESNGKSVALCELEIELKQGMPEHAVAVARKWRSQYGLNISTISKSMKGQRLHGDLGGNPVDPQLSSNQFNQNQPNQNPPKNTNALVKAVFTSCINQILINASELAVYTNKKREKSLTETRQEIEFIHQLRVAIRRLRVAIREFSLMVDGIDLAWEQPLIDVFRDLGKRRDADHLINQLQPAMLINGSPDFDIYLKEVSVVNVGSVDVASVDVASIDIGKTVCSEKFQDTLLCLIGFVNSQNLSAQSDAVNVNKNKKNSKNKIIKPEDVDNVLENRLNHWYKKSIKGGKNFVELTQIQQHSVRKHFKKLRYLAEFSALCYVDSAKTSKRAAAFSLSLKPVQDALGFYNDELVALEAYRALAKIEDRALFAVGWLSARCDFNAKKCQKAIDVFIKQTSQKNLFWQNHTS